MSRGLLLALAASASLAPVAAHASTAHVGGQNLHYNANGSEQNNVSVALADGVYTITDAGATINPNGRCDAVGPSAVTCPADGVTLLHVNVNNGDDAVTLSSATPALVIGGPGRDTLRAGSGDDALDGGDGSDWLEAGPGADAIAARDGLADVVSCGDGADSVVADRIDVVVPDCETVHLPPLETPGGDSLTSPGLQLPSILPAPRPVTVSNSGLVPLRLSCPATAAAACTGTLTLETRRPARGATLARRGRTLVIGRARYSIAPGRTARVRVRLSRRGRRIVRSSGRVRVTARATKRGGPNIGSRSRSVTLKRKPRRGRA